jgi:putative ATP-dependent endonuclease of OLD family
MKIQNVRIKNFRALKDVSIPFDTVTTFIGPNGAGKSTVLRALDWYFNGKLGSLTERDCSFGAATENVEVQVTFSDLTEKDREALGKYAPDGVATFTAWKRWSPDGSEVLSANAKGFPAFNLIKEASSAAAKKDLYTKLRSSQEHLDLPAATTGAAVDQAMTAWESSHTDQLVDAPEALQTNFFGFNSGGKMSGLFDFVLVTADLRASEESIDGRSSIIGRVLERSVDRAAADEAIAEIVEESRAKQQLVYEEKFKTQLEAITTQLNEVLESYSPGRAVTVSPAEVELKAPRTTFEVGVLDGITQTAVERQGHGFQRTLLISALQLLAQSGSASAEGVICLAIEEPELYQHPIQAQTFAKVLRSLAEDAGKRIQVTYATHSPYFLEARHFDQVRRLTRSSDATPVVTVHLAKLADVKARLHGVLNADAVDRQLDGKGSAGDAGNQRVFDRQELRHEREGKGIQRECAGQAVPRHRRRSGVYGARRVRAAEAEAREWSMFRRFGRRRRETGKSRMIQYGIETLSVTNPPSTGDCNSPAEILNDVVRRATHSDVT